MATALSIPSGLPGTINAPYISALTDTANIQDTINYLYYGSTKAITVPGTDGLYGILTSLQSQISSAIAGVNVHENVKYATVPANAYTVTVTGGTTDASGGNGINYKLTNAGTQTAFTIDGVTLTATDVTNSTRILIKNQADTKQNGIYVLTTLGSASTNWVLTRAEDSNNSIAGEMGEGDFVFVTDGSNPGNQNTSWVLIAPSGVTGSGPAGSVKIGTDLVGFTQYSGVGTYYIGTTAAQITSVNQALTGISSITLPSASGTIQLSPANVAGAATLTIPSRTGETLATTALAGGGTNASLTASAGAVAFSNTTSIAFTAVGSSGQILRSAGTGTPAWSTATFPATATATNTLLRADGTNWVASTVTYPATTTINNLLYSSGTSAIGEVTAPTTNNTYALVSVVSASASVTPAWTASTGTGSPVFSASPTFTGTIVAPNITPSASAGATVLALSTVSTSGVGIVTGPITLQTGNNTSGTSNPSNNSGGITIDVGTQGTGGTRGNINIGTAGTAGYTMNIGTYAASSGTKAINIGTAGTAGSTTTINIGTTSGTTPTITLNGAVTLGTTGLVGPASMDVFNTISSTVNAFGAATSLTIGGAAGATTTVAGGTGASTLNIGNGTNSGAGTTKTIQIGSQTIGTGATQLINIGNVTSNGGTSTINIGSTGTSTVTINGTANIGKALLQTVTTSAGASTLTFSAIPQTYKSLEVVYVVTTAPTTPTAVTTTTITFAGATSAYAYSISSVGLLSGTSSTTPTWNNGVSQAGIVVPAHTSGTTSIGQFSLHNYTSTSGSKTGSIIATGSNGSAMIQNQGLFSWQTAGTAVNSITLTFGGTTAGMVVTAYLYGLN